MIWLSDTFTKIHQKQERWFTSGRQVHDPRQRQRTAGVFAVRLHSLWSPMFTKKKTQNKQNGSFDSLLPPYVVIGSGVPGLRSINLHTFILLNIRFCVHNGCEFETLLRDADVVKTSSHVLHILLERTCSTVLLRWLLFSSVCADSFI